MRAWLLLLLSMADANAPGPPPAGWSRGEEVVGEAQGGLCWKIRMRRTFSSLEPIPVSWTIENATDRTATAVFDDARGPRVRLSRDGGETREAAESDLSGHAARYATIHPTAKSLAHRLDVRDFRFLFGRLAPGKYGLRLVWPAGGVRLEGEEAVAGDRVSPVFAFEIRAASLEAAERANDRDGRAELVVREPGRKADLVNRTDGDLVVAATRVSDAVRTWDRPQLSWTSWVPRAGWGYLNDSPRYVCGTSKSTITVKPGRSLEIPVWTPVDGIHRYEVECWPADRPSDRFFARSPAFRIDDFDAAWARALKEKK